MYAYSGNNPISFTDPLGLGPVSPSFIGPLEEGDWRALDTGEAKTDPIGDAVMTAGVEEATLLGIGAARAGLSAFSRAGIFPEFNAVGRSCSGAAGGKGKGGGGLGKGGSRNGHSNRIKPTPKFDINRSLKLYEQYQQKYIMLNAGRDLPVLFSKLTNANTWERGVEFAEQQVQNGEWVLRQD